MSSGRNILAAIVLASGTAFFHCAFAHTQEKADAKKNDDKDTVALISAASLGKTDQVLALLKRGVNPNEREPVKGGKTALIRAIMSKNINTVKALLECGPVALRSQKALMRQWEELPLKESVNLSVGVFGQSFMTGEPQRLMQGFLDRKR